MKSGFEIVVEHFDFSKLTDFPVVVFVLVGFILTTLIQSSSTTVAITLTALHSDAITLLGAMAIVLGSEVGTTIKLLMASINGIAAKKRVALGNFIYNAFLIILVIIILKPVKYFITEIIQIGDNLLALVFFQSGINILGLLIFFPFLNLFGRFLNSRFSGNDEGVKFIKAIPATEGGDLALDALAKETRRLFLLVIDFIAHAFRLSESSIREEIDATYRSKTFNEKYDYLKLLYGEIHTYSIKLGKESLNAEEKEFFERIISSARNCMFAAKSIKDSLFDIDQFRNSSNDTKYQYYMHKRNEVQAFYERISHLLLTSVPQSAYEEMVDIYNKMQLGYTSDLSNLYKDGVYSNLNEVEISTLINFNRELYSSHKAAVWALKDYLLNKEQAKYFAELPGFIR